MDKLSHESFEKDFQKITQVIQKEYTDLQNYIKKEKDLIKQGYDTNYSAYFHLLEVFKAYYNPEKDVFSVFSTYRELKKEQNCIYKREEELALGKKIVLMNYVSDYAEKELTQFDTKWREWAFKNKTVGVKVEIQKCDRGGSFEHGSVMTRW